MWELGTVIVASPHGAGGVWFPPGVHFTQAQAVFVVGKRDDRFHAVANKRVYNDLTWDVHDGNSRGFELDLSKHEMKSVGLVVVGTRPSPFIL